ncbi:MAG: zinc-dependent alcohol dehydrogenase [Acidimicrobiia bacterium]
MRALTWHGKRDVRVEDVPDPSIEEPTDAIIEITSSGLCGSDLHLYEVLGPYLHPGDVLGHEPMGIVREVGSEVTNLKPGDRVVVPFQIACGSCFMCTEGLQTQCETTQVTEHGKGAALFGYTDLYGSVPGAQAQYLRVPQAHYGPIVVPDGPPDERFLYLSDVLPTAWQAVAYADTPKDGVLAVLGLGPIGEMSCRIATHLGVERVIGIDLVPERLARAAARGVETVDLREHEDVAGVVKDMTAGRGADAVIDAVGMEAHGAPVAKLAHQMLGLLPDAVGRKLMETAGLDRLGALYPALEMVRRGGTVSLVGVYGGNADPMPMMDMFDKQVQLRMGQANVRRWVDDIMPLLTDEDPLGVDDFATDRVPLEDAPQMYDDFQKKRDGIFKVVFKP